MSLLTHTKGVSKVVVIGGGIAGLAATVHLMKQLDHSRVYLVEAKNRLGGLLHTVRKEGFLVEEAADSVAIDPSLSVWKSIESLGLSDQLLSARKQKHQALILQGNRLLPLPAGFMVAPTRWWPFVTTRTLTLMGKLRLALEPLVPRNAGVNGDESVAQFASRRLGQQVYERLIQPLVESIYGGDPSQLSMNAVMPQYVAMERQHGSLFQAMRIESKRRQANRQSKLGNPPRQLQAPLTGMSGLVKAIASNLPPGSVRLNTSVDRIERRADGRWDVCVEQQGEPILAADAVILATPAQHASRILRSCLPQLASQLALIDYCPKLQVTLGFHRNQISKTPEALGLFVPRQSRKQVRSVSLVSEKFPGRTPPGTFQLRMTLGEQAEREMDFLSDEQLTGIAMKEIAPLLRIQGNPLFRHVVRHRHALPLYTIGHLARLERIEDYLAGVPGVYLAGAAYGGIGVPHCMRSGEKAAESVLLHLRNG